MAFSIKDTRTEAAVRWLAKLQNMSLTDVVRNAIENERNRMRNDVPLPERLAVLSELYRSYPEIENQADKVFFDGLTGDATSS
jgi:hypothetical protein